MDTSAECQNRIAIPNQDQNTNNEPVQEISTRLVGIMVVRLKIVGSISWNQSQVNDT